MKNESGTRWMLGIMLTALVCGFVTGPTSALAIGNESYEVAASGVQPGQKVPSVLLKGLDKKMYDTGAPRDKVLLISFWASWCDPCRQESLVLNTLYEKFKGQMEIYGVNVTRYDKKEDAQKFVDSLQLRFPILLDKKGELFERFQGAAFPTSVLVDRNGTVREVIIGMLREEELQYKIQALASERNTTR